MEATPPIQLHIVTPEQDVLPRLQGRYLSRRFDTLLWVPPPGTTRKDLGKGRYATFWAITFPDKQALLEIYVPATGLSLVLNIDPAMISDPVEPVQVQVQIL